MKIILSILLFTIVLLSETINFKETRYMAALDFDRAKYGSLDIKDGVLILNYIKPVKETISYFDDKLTILKVDELLEYSFEEYPNAKYMGLILKAIIKNEYETLDELFDIKKEKESIEMISKPIIYNTIISIDISKVNKIVNKIIINMTNKDKITIETVN